MTPISIMPLAFLALAVFFLSLVMYFIAILLILGNQSFRRANLREKSSSRINELRTHCEAMIRELDEMEI